MSVIFSHPTGNANSRAAATTLARAGMLDQFHTTIASFPGSLLDKMAIGPFNQLKRRQFHPVLQPVTHMHPALEACRMVALKAGLQKLTQHEKGIFSIDAVYKQLDESVAKVLKAAKSKGSKSVYAYEDGALESFKMAQLLRLKCFYDLPIGYWRSSRRLLDKERERWPEWASTITGLMDSVSKLKRKDDEIKYADCIFVASTFTASTLAEYPGTLPEVKIIPYGFPAVINDRVYSATFKKRLKVLFVGGLSQRKGIADLLEAVDQLKAYVELTIVGGRPDITCPVLDAALLKHRYIPGLPHHQVLELMHEHDIFVFPSLFEGFGLVITEAMSQGTPVITTERTAGPDLITHNENGWLIKAGSPGALQEAIEKIISSPKQVALAGRAAMETAKKRPWEVYGDELVKALNDF